MIILLSFLFCMHSMCGMNTDIDTNFDDKTTLFTLKNKLPELVAKQDIITIKEFYDGIKKQNKQTTRTLLNGCDLPECINRNYERLSCGTICSYIIIRGYLFLLENYKQKACFNPKKIRKKKMELHRRGPKHEGRKIKFQ